MVDCSHESSYCSDITDLRDYGGDGGMQQWSLCNAAVDGYHNDYGKGSALMEQGMEIMAKIKNIC